MKKEIKKIKKKKPQETFTGKDLAQHIGALSENFQHGLSAVAEQFSGLNKKIDDIKRVQESHTEMIGAIAIDVEVLKEDVSVLKDEIKEVKSDIVELKTDMKEVKSILKEKADTKKVVSFDSRLSRVEKMQKA